MASVKYTLGTWQKVIDFKDAEVGKLYKLLAEFWNEKGGKLNEVYGQCLKLPDGRKVMLRIAKSEILLLDEYAEVEELPPGTIIQLTQEYPK